MIGINLNFTRTLLYIKKRTSKKKVNAGLRLYKKKIIDKVENEFKVEKELLLALMRSKLTLENI